MNQLTLLLLLFFAACTSYHRPEAIDGHPVAYDSMAHGSVKARAIKKVEKQDVCFDISLTLRGAGPEEALARNWTLAWVDQKNQYHLLTLNQRDPASVPKKTNRTPTRQNPNYEWINTFRTCAARAQIGEVKGIVLTPKELPYEDKRSLRLNW